MTTPLHSRDPAKAKEFFEAKRLLPQALFIGHGYDVMELDGGWRWWKDDGYDIE